MNAARDNYFFGSSSDIRGEFSPFLEIRINLALTLLAVSRKADLSLPTVEPDL
jgi:hypothetical protein